GIEVHATDVILIDNLIQNNAGVGLNLQGTQQAFVANWNPRTGIFNNNGGIGINNDLNNGGTRATDSVRIDNANLTDNQTFGIILDLRTGRIPPTHLVITNNCLRGN